MNEISAAPNPAVMPLVASDGTVARISAVIPAYKCADSILDVLQALFAQTTPCAEIIIVNDRSPDDLRERLEPVLSKIIYIENETNLGLSRTYNRGLRRATGDFVMTLHSDCILEPRYIQKILPLIATDDSVGAVTGQYEFIAFASLTLDDQLFSVLNRLPVENPKWTQAVEEIAFIEGKADLFRRRDLEFFEYFDERLSLTCEDQDLSAKYRSKGFRLLLNHDAKFRVKYNATQDSLWKVLRKQRTYARGQARVLLKYGLHAVKLTTENRNVRAMHRLSEVVVASLEWALVLASFFTSWALVALAALLFVRAGYYYGIASPMPLPRRLLAIPCGLVSDHLYTFGLVQGAILSILVGRV